MSQELFDIITARGFVFVFGGILGFFLCLWIQHMIKNGDQKELIPEKDFDNEQPDDSHTFYVKLPDNPKPVQIEIEEPLGINHKIVLDDVKYKVIDINHKVGSHTVFILGYTHDPK